MFYWAVKMFFNCTLSPAASNISTFFFVIRSIAMSLNKVHSEAWTIVKYSRASWCRTRNGRFAFSLCKCFYRRTNLFHGGRHVLNCDGCEKAGDESTQIPYTSAANMADGKTFSTPKRRLTIEKCLFEEKKARYRRHIEEHTFNHSVR